MDEMDNKQIAYKKLVKRYGTLPKEIFPGRARHAGLLDQSGSGSTAGNPGLAHAEIGADQRAFDR